MNQNDIFKRLNILHDKCYVKYSNYKVSSIVETDIGYFDGVNIENASFSLTICAERVAIYNAILNGAKKIKKLYLLTDNENSFGTPCGACRQVLVEFMDKNSEVHVYNKKGASKKLTIHELIPYAWDSSMLE